MLIVVCLLLGTVWLIVRSLSSDDDFKSVHVFLAWNADLKPCLVRVVRSNHRDVVDFARSSAGVQDSK